MSTTISRRFMLSALVCYSVALSTASRAARDEPQVDAAAKAARAEGERYLKAVEQLDPHIKQAPDGTLSIDAPQSVLNNVPKEVLDKIKADLDVANKEIKGGKLKAAELTKKDDKGLVVTKGGRNGTKRRWWGIEIYLDSKWSSRLVKAGASTAAVAALIAAAAAEGIITLPAAIPAGTLAAALALAAVILDLCNGSKGMVIRYPWTGPAHCWQQ